MKSSKKLLWAFSLLMPLLISATGNVFGVVPDDYTDDYVPEITARVARISYISGDAQIRRADSREWERVVQNLPIVEGDELATSGNALLEIQLNKDTFLRLSQNSSLKFLNLKDEGIAVSLFEGVLSARLFEFEKEKQYFEIDAPGTTVAVQRAGVYRVDAQDARSREKAMRVTVSQDGEARIYSSNSGFNLRGGRSAKVSLEGDYAGEWELADAGNFYDEFDEWTAKSDAAILKRIRDSYYDKYYDRDIYGAEDLNAYGEWIYTRQYGYVWRPFETSISTYDNWSPYRYGHWRWIPPYGWTWVNDEPWGWATYHHGRWIYNDGYWVWSPYGSERGSRSWWRPALVILQTIANNVYWCPLPYDYGYYNYNRHYHRRHRRDRDNNNGNNRPPNNPPNNPTNPPGNILPGTKIKLPPLATTVPPTGVVTVPESGFGRGKDKFLTPPLATAKDVLSKTVDTIDTPPILPEFKDLNGKVSKDIVLEKPRVVRNEPTVKIGAADRQEDKPLDKELEQKRIFGNRTPVKRADNSDDSSETTIRNNRGVKSGMNGFPVEPVRTGAVNRPDKKQTEGETTVENEPVKTRPNFENEPVRTRTNREDRKENTKDNTPPIYSPPIQREDRKSPPMERPQRQEQKYEPPPRREEPKYEPPPRNDPPPPRNDPPQKSDPPPSKSEPSPPLENKSNKKDG